MLMILDIVQSLPFVRRRLARRRAYRELELQVEAGRRIALSQGTGWTEERNHGVRLEG
jgi:hypothetical protein